MTSKEDLTALLKNRDFLRYFFANLITTIGDHLHQWALIAVILKRDPHDFAVGLSGIVVAGLLPAFLLGPLAGVYVDRWNRRNLMVFTDAVRAVLAFSIPFLWFGTQSMFIIYGILFTMGIFSAVHAPARQAMLPRLVDTKLLVLANSISNTANVIAKLLTGLLGGIIVAWVNPIVCFYIDSATFIIAGILTLLIIQDFTHTEPPREHALSHYLAEIREGADYIRNHAQVFRLMILFLIFSVVSGFFLVAVLDFARSVYSMSTQGFSTFMTAIAFGAAAGLVTVSQSRRISQNRYLPFLILLTLGICLVLFSFSQVLWASLLDMFLIGFLGAVLMIPLEANLQQFTEDSKRGRVFAARGMISTGSLLLSSGVAGKLCSLVGAPWLIGIIGTLTILFMVGIMCSIKDVRNYFAHVFFRFSTSQEFDLNRP